MAKPKKNGFSILIVDDEQGQRAVLSDFLSEIGYDVDEAGSVDEALEKARKRPFTVILTDYRMSGKTGLELLTAMKSLAPMTEVVLMTAFGTIEGAVEAMKRGAYDYIGKPINLDELELLLRRIIEKCRLQSENQALRAEMETKFTIRDVIAQSSAMQNVINLAARVAPSDATVLIRGESGTGKELIAKIIHSVGERKEKPFVAVNTAALNENLIESELFGHERGAFTGADKLRKGRFETADGGTLFLDEIGDIPPNTQVRLLRVLQERVVERVGGTEPIIVDVRVIAATHRDLERLIRDGKFREDLYYRLNVVSIDIPPLRERKEDIVPLINLYVEKFSGAKKGKGITFSREALDTLTRYDYPGNVRELENIVQRAIVLSRGGIIRTDDLPVSTRTVIAPATANTEKAVLLDLSKRIERFEKELVLQALEQAGGNQSKAARTLGISERNLRYRLEKWGLK